MAAPRVRLRTRIIATALELLPLAALLLIPGAQNEDGALIVVTAFAAGPGWLVLGRWEMAFVIWITRLFVLGFVAIVAGFAVWGVADCEGCSQTPVYVATGVVLAVFLLFTLASAYFVAVAREKTA